MVWHVNHRHPRVKGLSAGTEIARVQLPRRPAPPADAPAGPKSLSALPPRPQPPVLHRNLQRAGFQWIFRRLGATDAQLNWIADGQFSELLGDLRPGVESGDARETAIFGWLAERCRLLGGPEQQTSWRELNSQQLGAADQADYREVVALQDQWEQSFREVCESQIDQDDADRHLEEMATKQDGASLWLLSRRSNNYAGSVRLMSEAASTGFAQAQYEFARSLMMYPDAPKVVTQAPSPVTLLTELRPPCPKPK